MASTKLDESILKAIEEKALDLEQELNSNVLFYMGNIHPAYLKPFRNFLEEIASHTEKKSCVSVFLQTPGGSAQTVEKMVELIRHHFDSVTFIVPDMAMSAGTILCMAGDRIMMDYSSSLGPIDPQVLVNQRNGEEIYVPALGYLDKVQELIQKSADGTITAAEFALLKDMDLGLLRSYEQARDLSIALLKKWLAEYKFRNWSKHRSDPLKIGQGVTETEKAERAEEIAKMLGDNKRWHSHGRFIGISTLRNVLRLEIDDYTNEKKLRPLIRMYTDMLTDYMTRQGIRFVLHSPHIKVY